MARMVGVCTAILLLALSGCKRIGDELGSEQAYAFDIDGVNDSVAIGDTLNISGQLRKDGTDHSVAANTLEVSAQVACGNNEGIESKAKADADGSVSFPALQLNNLTWQGTCTLTISATIEGQAVTATHTFTLTDTGGKVVTPGTEIDTTLSAGWSPASPSTTGSNSGNNGTNSNIGNFVAGTERSAAELEQDGEKNLDGYLFLKNCPQVVLVALDGSDVQGTDAKGKLVISPNNSSWKYVVVGDVPSNCQLMYTESDTSAGRAVANVMPASSSSPAHGKLSMIRRSEHNSKTIITTGDVSDGSLYVSNDGRDWGEVSDVKWNDTTTTQTEWAAEGSDNYALLRVVSGDNVGWELKRGDIHVSIVKSSDRGGKTFAIAGLGSKKTVKVKLTNDLCGIRVMQFDIHGSVIYLHGITTTERDMTSDANGTISNLFAVDNPKQGCKLSLTIDGREVTAVSTARTQSDLPSINLEKSHENTIRFSASGSGSVQGAYILNSGVGGSGRSTLFKWLGGDMYSAMPWSTPAHKNIVLIILHTQNYRHVMYKEGS